MLQRRLFGGFLALRGPAPQGRQQRPPRTYGRQTRADSGSETGRRPQVVGLKPFGRSKCGCSSSARRLQVIPRTVCCGLSARCPSWRPKCRNPVSRSAPPPLASGSIPVATPCMSTARRSVGPHPPGRDEQGKRIAGLHERCRAERTPIALVDAKKRRVPHFRARTYMIPLWKRGLPCGIVDLSAGHGPRSLRHRCRDDPVSSGGWLRP